MLGVRQWRHVALRRGACCVSRQHRLCRWRPAHFHILFIKGAFVYSSSMKQCLRSVNHEQFPMQMTQNNKWQKILAGKDFPTKLVWRTPTKIHRERRRKQEAAKLLSTAKATSSKQRPQTCTEAASKYYNYTSNEADVERKNRLPTL